MVILQILYYGVGSGAWSPWSASVFRDNQTAVISGNGAARGIFSWTMLLKTRVELDQMAN
jgi:hypothetical protein